MHQRASASSMSLSTKETRRHYKINKNLCYWPESDHLKKSLHQAYRHHRYKTLKHLQTKFLTTHREVIQNNKVCVRIKWCTSRLPHITFLLSYNTNTLQLILCPPPILPYQAATKNISPESYNWAVFFQAHYTLKYLSPQSQFPSRIYGHFLFLRLWGKSCLCLKVL